MDASTDDNEHPELFDHLTADNRRRLRHILATRVVDVHNAIRGAETQTHLESSIGRVNLNEAFSHVGELASNTDLSAVDQASHLADIEDHLRRAVMEHPEQVVRGKIVEIEERWEEYLLDARSYRETKAMLGVPYHSELEDDRENIEALVNEARGMKTSRMEWDATLDIAAKLTDAARVARKLDDKLVQCIGAARELKAQDERDRAIEERAHAAEERARVAETRAQDGEARADRAEARAKDGECRAVRAEKRQGQTVRIAIAAVLVTGCVGLGGFILKDDRSVPPTPPASTTTTATP